MVVKCPNCGQQLRGEPGASGTCPKCKTKLKFPDEKQYQCPHCGFIQTGEGDTCVNCGKSMFQKPLIANIISKIMLICSLIGVFFSFLIFVSVRIEISLLGWSYALIPLMPFSACIIFMCISFCISRYCKRNRSRINFDGTIYKNDHGGFLWGLLGFLLPLVGLILFLVWIDDKPRTAKAVGAGALTFVIFPVIAWIMFFTLYILSILAYDIVIKIALLS